MLAYTEDRGHILVLARNRSQDVRRCVTLVIDGAAQLTPAVMADVVLRTAEAVAAANLPTDPFKVITAHTMIAHSQCGSGRCAGSVADSHRHANPRRWW